MHAAVANVGVAVAEFYPSVRLNGSPTLQALAPKDVFKGTSLQYMNIGPSVTLPIFEGGKLKSNLVLQEKKQQEAAITYHKAVLSAWHDVVNSLTAYKTEQMRRDRLIEQVGHAKQALALARSRYEQGVAEFTTLLDDARTVLQAEQQLAQSTTNVSIDLVALYKALGRRLGDDLSGRARRAAANPRGGNRAIARHGVRRRALPREKPPRKGPGCRPPSVRRRAGRRPQPRRPCRRASR